MIGEDTQKVWPGAPSTCVEYHTRLATTLTISLDLQKIFKKAWHNQLRPPHQVSGTHSWSHQRCPDNDLHTRRRTSYCMRLCQLISIHSSKLHLMRHRESVHLWEKNTISIKSSEGIFGTPDLPCQHSQDLHLGLVPSPPNCNCNLLLQWSYPYIHPSPMKLGPSSLAGLPRCHIPKAADLQI